MICWACYKRHQKTYVTYIYVTFKWPIINGKCYVLIGGYNSVVIRFGDMERYLALSILLEMYIVHNKQIFKVDKCFALIGR